MVTEMIDADFDKAVQRSGIPNAITKDLYPKLHALVRIKISGDDVADTLIGLCEQADPRS